MTEFPHVSPVVLRFLEWMGPRVAARQRRAPTGAAAAEVRPAAMDAESTPAVVVEPPAEQERQQVEHSAAQMATPALASRLLEAAARRLDRREAALSPVQAPALATARAPTLAPARAPTPTPAPAPTLAPARAPASAPGPVAASPVSGPFQGAPTGWPSLADSWPPWATPQFPLMQYPAGPFPGPPPDQTHSGPFPGAGPSWPNLQPQPLLAPGPLAWEQVAAAWAWPGPAMQAGPAPPLIGQGFDRALRPPVAQDEAPDLTRAAPVPGAPTPGTQPRAPGATSVQGAPGAQGGQTARGGVRLLEEARLRQMLAEILRADALRHGLDLKER